MHDESSDLEDVAIMPLQFADMGRSAQRSRLHMLMLAVLQDAIRIRSRAKPAALAGNRATIEAGSWLFDEQDRSPFSLNWICDNLGIEGGGSLAYATTDESAHYSAPSTRRRSKR